MVANAEYVEAIRTGVVAARLRVANHRPIVACVMSKSGERIHLPTPTETIPCCTEPDAAARVLGKAHVYAQWRRKPCGTFPRWDDLDFPRARQIIASAEGRSDDGWLSSELVDDLAQAIGLPMLEGTVATTSEQAVEAARRVGFPVALKSASAEIPHKTDVGAVQLHLRTDAEVRAAFKCVRERMAAHSEAAASAGMLVQPMHVGVELLVGATRDPQLGPLLAFGLGGTRVEIVRDVCYRLAPLTDCDAHDLVRSIRGYPLLTGYRGQPPVDVAAIETLLLRVSQAVTELPKVRELDLNPVVAAPCSQGCRIVDARIRVSPGASP
jgi:acyl-CoA synthetase (NDP forming)